MAVGAALLLSFAMRDPERFAFLDGARVVRTEEWIETGGLPGPGSLKLGGIYRLPGDLSEVSTLVGGELIAAGWKQEKDAPKEKGFRKDRSYLTLMPRPAEHEVTVHMQEYREPKTVDRVRLWLRKFLPKR